MGNEDCKQLVWYGRINKMEDERLPKTVMTRYYRRREERMVKRLGESWWLKACHKGEVFGRKDEHDG